MFECLVSMFAGPKSELALPDCEEPHGILKGQSEQSVIPDLSYFIGHIYSFHAACSSFPTNTPGLLTYYLRSCER